jgi:hypothetical protein
MKNTYKLLYIVMMAVIFTSCKNDPIMFDSSKTFVAFTSSSASVVENENALDIPLMVAGIPGSPSVTVNFEVRTEGLASPAVEGTDFTIVSSGSVDFTEGAGMANITIHPIDNDVFTGNKSFELVITSNSKNYPTGAEDVITVTLKDNEHPLAKWIGTYSVAAVSYGNPGAWDEGWLVTTEPDPNDVTKLIITGVGAGTADPIKATINLEDMSITLSPGQSVGDVYGYGTIGVYKGTDAGDDVILDQPLEGVIQEDGTILIDHWAHYFTDGAYANSLWDVFNTTWTKQ